MCKESNRRRRSWNRTPLRKLERVDSDLNNVEQFRTAPRVGNHQWFGYLFRLGQKQAQAKRRLGLWFGQSERAGTRPGIEVGFGCDSHQQNLEGKNRGDQFGSKFETRLVRPKVVHAKRAARVCKTEPNSSKAPTKDSAFCFWVLIEEFNQQFCRVYVNTTIKQRKRITRISTKTKL